MLKKRVNYIVIKLPIILRIALAGGAFTRPIYAQTQPHKKKIDLSFSQSLALKTIEHRLNPKIGEGIQGYFVSKQSYLAPVASQKKESHQVMPLEVLIAYRVYLQSWQKNPARNPARGNVLIVQGRRESMFHYEHLVKNLLGQGYSVFLFDHRGQGESSRLVSENHSKGHLGRFTNYMSDLLQFVNVLKRNYPNTMNSKMYVLSHSTGSLVFGHLLLEINRISTDKPGDSTINYLQNKLAAVAMIAPYFQMPFFKKLLIDVLCLFKDAEDYVDPRLSETSQFNFRKYRFNHTTNKAAKQYVENLFVKHPNIRLGSATCGWVGETSWGQKKLWQSLPKDTTPSNINQLLYVPTLIVHGGKDPYTKPATAKKYCSMINTSVNTSKKPCVYIPFQEGKHALHFEPDIKYQSKTALQQIYQFFDRH